MKKFVFVVFLLCVAFFVNAQTQYTVSTKTILNVRSEASADGYVIGSLQNGATIEVYEIKNNWARINYRDKTAYVSAQYIKQKQTDSTTKTEVKIPKINRDNLSLSNFSFDSFDIDLYATWNVRWMVFVILALSCVLWYIRDSADDIFFRTIHVIKGLLLLTISIFEIVYLVLMGSEALWFCQPDSVGWIWTIINFLVFGFVACNQVMSLFVVLANSAGRGYFSLWWGVCSWVVFVIATVICALKSWDSYFKIALALFALFQLIQIFVIFKGVTAREGIMRSIWCSIIYLIGSLATVVVLVYFISLLIIVIIALLALMIFSMSGRKSSDKTTIYVGENSWEGVDEYGNRWTKDIFGNWHRD